MPYPAEVPEPDLPLVMDPAAIAAITRCALARWRGTPTAMHPGPCRWCEKPLRELDALIEDFGEWASNAPDGQAEVRRWEALPAAERSRRIAVVAAR